MFNTNLMWEQLADMGKTCAEVAEPSTLIRQLLVESRSEGVRLNTSVSYKTASGMPRVYAYLRKIG